MRDRLYVLFVQFQVSHFQFYFFLHQGEEIVFGHDDGMLRQIAFGVYIGFVELCFGDGDLGLLTGLPYDVYPVTACGVQCTAIVKEQSLDGLPAVAGLYIADFHQCHADNNPYQFADAADETCVDAECARQTQSADSQCEAAFAESQLHGGEEEYVGEQ